MKLGAGDLVLCAGTLPQAILPERIEIAAAAGFRGISVFVDDYDRARAAGWSDADLRRLLTDHGIGVAEVDPLLSWLPGTGLAGDATARGEGFFRYTEADLHRVAEALGARSMNVVAYAETLPPRDAVVDAFAGVCDRAAERGLRVHLEFLPWTGVPDAPAALAIAREANRSNGGILIDTWHHFRSGLPDALLGEIPGHRIQAIQISDAPREPETDPVTETLHRRLLPGEGAIGLKGILATLRRIGVDAPIGVEVFSDSLAAKPAAEAADLAFSAARRVLDQVSKSPALA